MASTSDYPLLDFDIIGEEQFYKEDPESAVSSSSVINESDEGTIINTEYPNKGYSQIDYIPAEKAIAGNVNARSHTIRRLMRKFVCTYCSYSCTYRTAILIHIHTHTNPKKKLRKIPKVPCAHCDMKVKSMSELQRHIMSIHPGVKNLSCEHCDFTTNCKKKLSTHVLKSHDKMFSSSETYKCEHCPFECIYPIQLFIHLKKKHRSDSPYPCNLCDERFCNFIEWKQHKLNMHSTAKKLYKCEICNYVYGGHKSLMSHYSRKHASANDMYIKMASCVQDDDTTAIALKDEPIDKTEFNVKEVFLEDGSSLIPSDMDLSNCEGNVISLDFPEGFSQIDYIPTSEPPNSSLYSSASCCTSMKRFLTKYICNICNYSSNYKGRINYHMKRHNDPKKSEFSCLYCHTPLNSMTDYQNHVDTNHPEEAKLHRCKVCSYSTNYRYSLLRHVLVMHSFDNTELKMYECNQCEFKCKYQPSLFTHMKRKHASKEPYPCDTCGVTFTNYTTLKRHSLRQHAPHDMYKCNLCDFACKTKVSFASHHNEKHKVNLIKEINSSMLT